MFFFNPLASFVRTGLTFSAAYIFFCPAANTSFTSDDCVSERRSQTSTAARSACALKIFVTPSPPGDDLVPLLAGQPRTSPRLPFLSPRSVGTLLFNFSHLRTTRVSDLSNFFSPKGPADPHFALAET